MWLETVLRVKGKLVIERISRISGEVVERRELENALTRYGATHIRQAAYNTDPLYATDNGTAYRPDKLVLMGTGWSVIKEIPSGSRTGSDSGSAIVHTIEWNDTSTDEYTISYAGIGLASVPYSGTINPDDDLIHAAAVSPAFTKTAPDIVKYTWQINITYTVMAGV